jgi:hypothetical protein
MLKIRLRGKENMRNINYEWGVTDEHEWNNLSLLDEIYS